MSPQVKNKIAYCDTLARVAEEWGDIDDYYNAVVEADLIDDDFRARSLEIAVKAKIRRDLKGGKIMTKDGRMLRPGSIIMKDKQGNARRVYKDEMLFDVGDCVQVVQYWRDRRKYCGKKVRYYTKLAIKLHGESARDLLPLRD